MEGVRLPFHMVKAELEHKVTKPVIPMVSKFMDEAHNEILQPGVVIALDRKQGPKRVRMRI